MAASVQCRRPRDRSLGMVMKEVDEDLAIFLQMQRREKEKDDLIFENSPEYDDSSASNPDSSVASHASPILIPQNTVFDTLLDAPDNAKSDFDWLLSPPPSPSAPSTEVQVPEAPFEVSKGATTDLKSEKSEQAESTPEETCDASEKPATSTSTSSSHPGNVRPLSSGARKLAVSRFPTPTRRPLAASSKPSRSSTPNSRGTSHPSKPMAPPVKSSFPSKSAARSCTPPARSAMSSSSKASARSSTPTPKTSTPSSASSVSVPSSCPSTDNKTGPKTLTSSRTLRGISPSVRSRPKITSEVRVSSSSPPPNMKFSVPKRSSLASKGRPTTSGKSRQKSCSPLRERVNVSSLNTMNTSLSRSQDDEVNPALVGTKMVERVVNMRKLAPPKDDYQPLDDHHAKKSSLDKCGFGRSLSKKSLDMAIRHMDIRSSVPVNLNRKRVPASSSVSSLSSAGSTKTDALLARLTSTDSDDSMSSSSIVLDGCGIRSENQSYS